MRSIVSTRVSVRRMNWMLVPLVAVAVSLSSALVAGAAPSSTVIVLPGATSAEGIATGRGSTFFAGDLIRGDIYRGDLQRGTAELFIDVSDAHMAVGMKVDTSNDLLFVAGGSTGQGYVYDINSGVTIAKLQLGNPAAGTFINDVAIARDGAWFTDSAQPVLYFVPIGPRGALGPVRTLALSGPASDTSGAFNVNGIAATPNGAMLIVAHSGRAALYTVNPTTGASAPITGVSVPNVDGILLEAGRLFAVQNFLTQIAVIRLSSNLSSGVVEEVITNAAFHVPATVARHGGRLAVVNAKFDTGFPPTAAQYEVVVVPR